MDLGSCGLLDLGPLLLQDSVVQYHERRIPMGGRALLVSGTKVLDQKIGRGFTHKTTATMVNRPPASFIYGRPPFRAATAPQRNLPRRRTQRTRLVAARRSWAARGLSSGDYEG